MTEIRPDNWYRVRARVGEGPGSGGIWEQVLAYPGLGPRGATPMPEHLAQHNEGIRAIIAEQFPGLEVELLSVIQISRPRRTGQNNG